MTKKPLRILIFVLCAVLIFRAGRIVMAETMFQSPPASTLSIASPTPRPAPTRDPSATLSPDYLTDVARIITVIAPLAPTPTPTPTPEPVCPLAPYLPVILK